jgi:hypothetical protein
LWEFLHFAACGARGAPSHLLLSGMGLESQAALLVAAADLKVVRLLRAAMNGCGCRVTALGPAPNLRCDRFEPRLRVHPTPRFEPRPVIHPTPRFEARFTIHPRPNIADQPLAAPVEPEQPIRFHSPIQAPWKVLPWETPILPQAKIKRIVQRPDIVSKGLLLDMFI